MCVHNAEKQSTTKYVQPSGRRGIHIIFYVRFVVMNFGKKRFMREKAKRIVKKITRINMHQSVKRAMKSSQM